MRVLFTALVLLIFCVSVSFAGDLESLNNTKKQINVRLIELSGAILLNDALMKDCARRSVRYDESIVRLQEQLSKINDEIKQLTVEPVNPGYKKVD